MAVDWESWQQQMRQGGFGTTAIPGMEGVGSPSMAWAGWELGQPQQQLAAPAQTTDWGQVPMQTESNGWTPAGIQSSPLFNYAQPSNPWAYQSGNPFGMEFSQDATPASGDTSMDKAPLPAAPAPAAPNTTTTSVPAGTGVGVNALAPLVTGQASGGGGTGASWSGQDYKLPSGEVLPGSASFTLDILGRQVRAPGYYDPGSATGGRPQAIFQTAQGMEDAMGRFSRRLSDAVRGGADPNDPNIIYRELARVRDDAMVALGLRADDPQLAAKLRAATGFVHLDRFVRGANGETGYTAAPGTTGAPAAPGGNTVVAPALDPGTGGGGTVPGQTPGAGNPQYNLDLQGNEVLRTAALLQRLGLGSPMAQSNMLGADRAKRATQLLDPWMQTQGMTGGNVADNFSSLMDKFVGYLTQSGGMGAIAGDARAAAQALPGNALFTNAPDSETIAMLKGFNQLANLPMNPWMQRAYGNLQDQSIAQYGNQLNEAAQGGMPLDFNYLKYIQGNPLFSFLTGGK